MLVLGDRRPAAKLLRTATKGRDEGGVAVAMHLRVARAAAGPLRLAEAGQQLVELGLVESSTEIDEEVDGR
jgi:hypothetical protein